MKPMVRLSLCLLIALALAACVAGSPESASSASGNWILQFLLGLWHGIIAPFMLLGELINRFLPHLLPWKVKMYEVKASGVAYDAGFYLGLGGGGPIAFRTWRRRR
ncbi:MAG TPA: hypothetical protein VGS12_13000 [Caulobacteraceae bacterium]|nr:hypothetical protein [Caulobacteraceae bacterium]